jgi:hypothetical protein
MKEDQPGRLSKIATGRCQGKRKLFFGNNAKEHLIRQKKLV